MQEVKDEQITMEQLRNKLKEKSEWFTVVNLTDASMQVFRKKKITHPSKEIMWIRKEDGKIACVLFDSSYKKLAKELDFQGICPTFGGHYAGYINIKNDEKEA